MIQIALATCLRRKPFLRHSIKRILDSETAPDLVSIYFNDYDAPKWTENDSRIRVVDNEGDIGAAAMFYFLEGYEGVYMPIGDDLIYDKRYITYLSMMAEKYRSRAVVGLHAFTYLKHPVRSYFKSMWNPKEAISYHYQYPLAQNTLVHMLGTGTMAFHTDTLTFCLADIPERNMVDPLVMAICQQKEIPQIALRRRRNYVQEIPEAQTNCIWQAAERDDTKQTEIVNSLSGLRLFEDKIKL